MRNEHEFVMYPKKSNDRNTKYYFISANYLARIHFQVQSGKRYCRSSPRLRIFMSYEISRGMKDDRSLFLYTVLPHHLRDAPGKSSAKKMTKTEKAVPISIAADKT